MPTARAHEAMDAQTVADLLGVSPRMLNNYINNNDLPSQGSGRSRTFVWSEVLQWYVGYRLQMEMGGGNDGSDDSDFAPDISDSDVPGGREDIRQANLRKTRAEADLKQLQLSKLRSEVITLADIRPKLDRAFGNLATNLRTLGPKLINRLEGVKTRSEREAIAKEELENLAIELSTGAFVEPEKGSADDNEAEETVESITAAADTPEKLPTKLEILRGCAEILDVYDSL